MDSVPRVNWDFEGIHYFDNGPLTVQYLLVLDALNFCFWPGFYSLTPSLYIGFLYFAGYETFSDTLFSLAPSFSFLLIC